MDNWRVKQLEDMIAQDPEDEFVLFALAQEYGKSQDYIKSIAHYTKLKDINPDYVVLYYHLAATYVITEDHDEALQTYSDGIRIATKLNDQHALAELKNAKLNFELEL
jgi:tetratricopeptide (TPR) repeat protein